MRRARDVRAKATYAPGVIGVVVNANARKNRKRPSLVRELRGALGSDGQVVPTRQLEELRPAVETLLAEGATVLVAAGGDGALHRMANVLLDLRDEGKLETLPPLVPTNGGTIDFVAKKLGLRGDALTILRRPKRDCGAHRDGANGKRNAVGLRQMRAI